MLGTTISYAYHLNGVRSSKQVGTTYYCILNQQGDVILLVDGRRAVQAEYE